MKQCCLKVHKSQAKMAVKIKCFETIQIWRFCEYRDFLEDHKDGGTLRVKLLGLPVLLIRRRVRVQLCRAKKMGLYDKVTLYPVSLFFV